ncbi:PREDICTED: transcription factor Adf-1-like isoform X2 [Bactrocera latifrons]|uniref:transcription factor Adf-1-like isoform X2 n=1 Tax=Bactrocera latifrons TaxID=174628 RepID=UPI0008DCCD3D|nr:PREDICTED: transcription factor Adf-1-like isoform X2 [Bactrocera latifrons]
MSRNSGERNHNREENKKLVNLVEPHPQLYDRAHDRYGKTNAVDEAWSKIGQMWGKPVPECKERWRNIRAAYARSIDAYKTKRGPNRGKQYYLAKEMEFFKPHLLKEAAAIDTATAEPLLTEYASQAALNNDHNNEINNSAADANENDVHNMNNTHADETFALVMPLIDKMDEQSLRDLQQIIEQKLRQTVAVESNNDNELSVPMQQLPLQSIKQEPELSL